MENPLVIVAGIVLAIVLSVVDNPMYADASDTEGGDTSGIETACQPFTTADAGQIAALSDEQAFTVLELQP